MLEGTVLNNRQHVGLQKLCALAAITHSSLGPCKSYKFIRDDGGEEAVLVCSCYRILENLELTCPVGQLVFETIQAHQKVYHTGSGCLLFLAGAWSRAALDCLHKGISVQHIVSAMSEGMDSCVDVCMECAIPVEVAAGATPLERGVDPIMEASQASHHLRGMTQVDEKTLKISKERKIKLSRHFCETRSQNICKVTQTPEPNLSHVIAQGLSHGCEDTMALVLEAIQMQSQTGPERISSPAFDVTKVVTCLLPGLSEQHSCVVQGFVVLLSAEQILVTRHLIEQNLKVALITGDLSDSYRHLGFSRPTGMRRVSERLAGSSGEDDWVEKVGTLLLSLDVNLILVSGHACEKVIQRCRRHRILVVEGVKVSILKAFADSTGAVPVSYATQLSKRCVGAGAKAAIRRDLGGRGAKPATAVNICPGGNSRLVSVILASCVRGKLPILEEQFWACAHRLHHALKDGALLPGAGRTEMLCVHRLLTQAEQHMESDGPEQQAHTWKADNHYRNVVWQLMAEAFMDYISTVMVNTGSFSKVKARTLLNQQLQNYKGQKDFSGNLAQVFFEGAKQEGAVSSAAKPEQPPPAAEIYDNLSVKQEAWRKALDLVFLVLQTDAEVITGAGRDTDAAKQNLMLL